MLAKHDKKVYIAIVVRDYIQLRNNGRVVM